MQKVFWFRISTFILDYLAHKMFFSVKLSHWEMTRKFLKWKKMKINSDKKKKAIKR